MKQLIEQSLTPYTFPFTVMLGISLVFFLVTILTGAGEFEADVEAEVDIDADVDGDADGDGFLAHTMEFITLGEAPIIVALSIWSLFTWFLSVQTNMLVNSSANTYVGFGLLIPIIIIATLITRQFVKPIAKLFKMMNDVEKVGDKTIGGICIVRNKVTNKGGFAEIKTGTSPIQINVYTDGDEIIEKGGRALVLEFNEAKNRYLIESFTEEI